MTKRTENWKLFFYEHDDGFDEDTGQQILIQYWALSKRGKGNLYYKASYQEADALAKDLDYDAVTKYKAYDEYAENTPKSKRFTKTEFTAVRKAFNYDNRKYVMYEDGE